MPELIIYNAKIVSTLLGYEDHGIMTSFINLEWDSAGQGFGGYALRDKYLYLWIKGILAVTEKTYWKDVDGSFVRIEKDSNGWNGKIIGIGHITKDIWFYPNDDFKIYDSTKED